MSKYPEGVLKSIADEMADANRLMSFLNAGCLENSEEPQERKAPMIQKIYVASSWRNERQQGVVTALNASGYDAYDFRNAATAFSCADIDDSFPWTAEICHGAVNHPIAIAGFDADMKALNEADLCVIVLPSGRSAHWEFGYAVGKGTPTVAFFAGEIEPEIIYRSCEAIFDDLAEMIRWINKRSGDRCP